MGTHAEAMPVVGNCTKCGAAIRWGTTSNGTPIPLNALPIPVAMQLQRDSMEVVIRPAFAIHQTTCTRRRASQRTSR